MTTELTTKLKELHRQSLQLLTAREVHLEMLAEDDNKDELSQKWLKERISKTTQKYVEKAAEITKLQTQNFII